MHCGQRPVTDTFENSDAAKVEDGLLRVPLLALDFRLLDHYTYSSHMIAKGSKDFV